jgi:hypothetical protein
MSLEKSLGKSLESPWGLAIVAAGAIVVLYLGYKAVKGAAAAAVSGAAGLVTGNNVVTANQTDLNGNTVTAYQGAGVAGTLGAAANSVSGGAFASIGEWIGGKLYDLTHPTSSSGTNGAGGTGSNVAGTGASTSSPSASDINFGLIDGGASGGW